VLGTISCATKAPFTTCLYLKWCNAKQNECSKMIRFYKKGGTPCNKTLRGVDGIESHTCWGTRQTGVVCLEHISQFKPREYHRTGERMRLLPTAQQSSWESVLMPRLPMQLQWRAPSTSGPCLQALMNSLSARAALQHSVCIDVKYKPRYG
jgi:hypothetical protein